jgi:hypothetical protein
MKPAGCSFLLLATLLAPLAAVADLVNDWDRGPSYSNETAICAWLSLSLLLVSTFGLVIAVRINRQTRRMAEAVEQSDEQKEA